MHVSADADCWCCYHFEKADDPRCLTEYVRVPTPDSVAEKARRAVEAILSNVSVNEFRQAQDYNRTQHLIAIIATEFEAGGEQGENSR